MSDFRIEIIDKDYPYEEITQLLHAGYKEHLDAGRNYMAANQNVEKTKERLDGKTCVLAYNGENELVASIAGKIADKKNIKSRKWYEDDACLYIDQMAVRPDYRETNVLALMALKVMRLDMVRNVDSWMSDTAVTARELVDAYVNLGFQIVDVISWSSTNYYSYVFRKAVRGKVYKDSFVKRKLFWAGLRCRICFDRYGKKRFW